jgi:hypothetical protein
LTYREPDDVGRLCFYILQKKFPHYVGLLVTNPREGALVNSPVPSYNLWITFSGCLNGNFIPGYADVLEEIQDVFNDMAIWYYQNRLLENPKTYSRFKIQTDVTITGK